MKKILLSLGIIAIVAVGAIGATRAYFSDTESSTGNTFTAGTLDITLDANGIVNNTSDPTLPVSLSNLYPGYNGATEGDYYYPAVANTGSMDFDWKFSLLKTNGTSPNGGDLGQVLKIKIEESQENNGPWAYPAGGSFNCQNAVIWPTPTIITYPNTTVSTIYDGNVSTYSSMVDMGELATGKGRCYRMSFYLDNDLVGNDNDYQGASAVYTIGVNAEQIH